MSVADALTIAAPYYNLAFVTIVLYLFLKLFRTKTKKVFMLPWYLILGAVSVFIVEEVLTVLRSVGWITITGHINGFFELIIIAFFTYALFAQKDYLKKHHYKLK